MEHHVQMPLVMQLISLDTWQMPTKRKPQKPKDTQQKWVKVLSQSVGDIWLFFFVFVKVCQMAGKVWQMKIGILWAQQVTTCISIVYKNILPMTMMPRSAFFIYVLFI